MFFSAGWLPQQRALLLALIARNDIEMPPDMIREDALIGASVVIAALAVMSSPKQPRLRSCAQDGSAHRRSVVTVTGSSPSLTNLWASSPV
jgi:hypothetical protein